MKVFISYASEDRSVAEEIHFAIIDGGHETFFDRRDLEPGAGYHGRIRAAVRDSDAFVFLISPHSVEKGCYTLTELKYAEDIWPSPKGHVIPVLIRETEIGSRPAYLRAVTPLEPAGNIAAEVADAVERLRDEPVPKPRNGKGQPPALEEVDYVSMAEDDLASQGVPAPVIELMKRSLAVAFFLKQVASRGTAGKAYKADIGEARYLAHPSDEYVDVAGRRCRTVRVSKRIGGRWQETPSMTFYWKEGDWHPPEVRDKTGQPEPAANVTAHASGSRQQAGPVRMQRPQFDQEQSSGDGVLRLADDEPFENCRYCNARVKARNMDLHLAKVHPEHAS